ncbi:MAG: hypothetical protein V9E94_04675 [Microthrixaceae bacterium]
MKKKERSCYVWITPGTQDRLTDIFKQLSCRSAKEWIFFLEEYVSKYFFDAIRKQFGTKERLKGLNDIYDKLVLFYKQQGTLYSLFLLLKIICSKFDFIDTDAVVNMKVLFLLFQNVQLDFSFLRAELENKGSHFWIIDILYEDLGFVLSDFLRKRNSGQLDEDILMRIQNKIRKIQSSSELIFLLNRKITEENNQTLEESRLSADDLIHIIGLLATSNLDQNNLMKLMDTPLDEWDLTLLIIRLAKKILNFVGQIDTPILATAIVNKFLQRFGVKLVEKFVEIYEKKNSGGMLECIHFFNKNPHFFQYALLQHLEKLPISKWNKKGMTDLFKRHFDCELSLDELIGQLGTKMDSSI